jgi:DNA-binding response OmpR family regulator
MKVLLIDDDPDLRGLLSHYIRQRCADATVD